MTKGIFYGVGVGPGDPELLTLKAVRLLTECPVIALPRTGGSRTLAYDIASGAVDLSNKILLPLDFTMQRDKEAREQSYQKAAAAVLPHLSAGRDVAMLNLGDPSLYGSHSYIQALIRQAGYETRVVAGITSFCESAARLGVSLTEMDRPLHILPAGSGDLIEGLRLPGTKVIMKAARGMGEVRAALKAAGLYETTVAVERCALPGERLCRSLDDLPDDAGYFTTLIVRERV
jgi:precorrin-2/cobalt-factor-2 C20-methyltransferase